MNTDTMNERDFGRMEGDIAATLQIVTRLEKRMDQMEAKFGRMLVMVSVLASASGVGGGMFFS